LGSGGIAPQTSALDGSEWSASRPGLFTPVVTEHVMHFKAGWSGRGGEEKKSRH